MKEKQLKILVSVLAVSIILTTSIFIYKSNASNVEERCEGFERLEPMSNASEFIIGDDASNMIEFYQEILEAEKVEGISVDKFDEALLNLMDNKDTGLEDGVLYVITNTGELNSDKSQYLSLIAVENDILMYINFTLYNDYFSKKIINYEVQESIDEYEVYNNVGEQLIFVWGKGLVEEDNGHYTGGECFDNEIRQSVNYIHDSYLKIEK